MKLVGRDLGVRYLLEGSGRQEAGRVRINVRLVDAAVGNHIWVERYDRPLQNMFVAQDEITSAALPISLRSPGVASLIAGMANRAFS